MISECDFIAMQHAIQQWEEENFGHNPTPPHQAYAGMREESGEITRHVLKLAQGIRGTRQDHLTGILDGIGDVSIYLINLYRRLGLGIIPVEHNRKALFTCIKTPVSEASQQLFHLEQAEVRIYFSIARLGDRYPNILFRGERLLPSEVSVFHQSASSILFALASCSNILRMTLAECIAQTWHDVVSKRNWIAHPLRGVS